MTTAGDILKSALEKMGADIWHDEQPIIIDVDHDIDLYNARPAWRDGWDQVIAGKPRPSEQSWFILPDGWSWMDGLFKHREPDANVFTPERYDPHWLVDLPSGESLHKTAPEAFRAAQKWIDEQ